ncbi:hypothetical protein EI94DRAFT_1890916 [Lactarius quietus]|nr:hypothetical protein EI94DRAFT_1890916 [Lactarius quietus]
MFQPTRHTGFPHHPHPSFHTDRTIFHSEGPVLGGTGWCSTTIETKVQTTNGWSPSWVDPRSLPPASAPWHSARTSPTSHRPLHIGTWPTAQPSFSGPTMPRNRTIQWCAAPTTPSSARANTSFSCPSTSRKQYTSGGEDDPLSQQQEPFSPLAALTDLTFCNGRQTKDGSLVLWTTGIVSTLHPAAVSSEARWN